MFIFIFGVSIPHKKADFGTPDMHSVPPQSGTVNLTHFNAIF
jgi:hypothetical protein